MTDSAKTFFGLLRHAVTEWNALRRIQGQADSPLTPAGRSMALEWGKLLAGYGWHRILSSDLGRARDTAGRINRTLNLPVTADTRLREMDWGKWTGYSVSELKTAFPDQWSEQTALEWDFRPPGGESFRDVWQRGIDVLREASGTWPGENILVVTHEGVIKSILYHKTTLSDLIANGQGLLPYHLHCLVFSDGRLSVERLNSLSLSA